MFPFDTDNLEIYTTHSDPGVEMDSVAPAPVTGGSRSGKRRRRLRSQGHASPERVASTAALSVEVDANSAKPLSARVPDFSEAQAGILASLPPPVGSRHTLRYEEAAVEGVHEQVIGFAPLWQLRRAL
jgi:hypothetical protein